jgi:serine/threonine-protein kinase RsbW
MVTLVSFRDERTAHRNFPAGLPVSGRDVSAVASRKTQRQATVEASATDAVDLRVPADPAYLVVVRTATAGLAARLNLSIDEIEDLRIAVDEACSLLLAGRAHPGRTLNASFTVGNGTLAVVIAGPAEVLPETASFSWSVLRALAGEVVTGVNDSGAWIRLTHVGRGEQ